MNRLLSHLRASAFICGSLFLLAKSSPARAEQYTADVVVYGSTPAGICAAIAAAREGARVILVEPTDHVGGVNTGGLSFSDSNQTVRAAHGSLFNEFHERMEADYARRGVKLDYSTAVKDQAKWTYEPHVAMQVTQAMLKEAGVVVETEHPLAKVVRREGRIVDLVTKPGDVFSADVFVDAGYEGDLMAAAGVSWTIGREGRSQYGESLAGRQYPKRPMAISGLDTSGKPLPLVTAVEPAREANAAVPDDQLGDNNVMVYSFRLCLTAEPENMVPFPKPAKYDPARFEAARRYYKADPKALLAWDLYPLPGKKIDANNGIGKQFSMGIVGGGNAWCEADEAGRREIWEAHKQYTLELYHFLTTDETVPQPLREQLAKFGLCKDEFASYGHWSPQLYVREGRRMLGGYVLTQADILTNRTKPDSIAVCSFPIDSHDCRRVARGENEVVNEGTIFPKRVRGTRQGPAYQVPYRAITPKADECTNLLVPTALSTTHVAYSSVRVECSWMTIGQAAGVAAALAADSEATVQEVPYADLAARLQAQKQVLDHPAIKGDVEIE
ncbi:MAG: FAD-dependent oxidoreductase [Pirellulales bacterium]